MRTCPHCGRNYPDEYSFCLDDGEPLSVLDGRKTDLIKGPYTPGGTTEHIPAKPGSEETVVLPPPDIPGPTEPSPLPTIKDRGLRPVVEAAPRGIQRSHSAGTTRFAIGAILVLCVIGLAVFLSQYESGVSITSGQSANANLPQTRPNNPANGVTAPSNSQPVVTQPVDSQPGGDQPVSELPAGQPVGPIDAPAVTDAETNRQVLISQSKRTQIKRWNVSEGDVFNPCSGHALADVIWWNPIGPDGSTEETHSDGPYPWVTPARVVTIESSDERGFEKGQRMAVLDEILHIGATVKVRPADAARISDGTQAIFTEAGTNRKFQGYVDLVNPTTSKVHLRFDDKQVFHMQRPNQCLDLSPGRSGIVRFSVP